MYAVCVCFVLVLCVHTSIQDGCETTLTLDASIMPLFSPFNAKAPRECIEDVARCDQKTDLATKAEDTCHSDKIRTLTIESEAEATPPVECTSSVPEETRHIDDVCCTAAASPVSTLKTHCLQEKTETVKQCFPSSSIATMTISSNVSEDKVSQPRDAKVFIRKGPSVRIVTRANHVARLERVSVAKSIVTLAVSSTAIIPLVDYVLTTRLNTRVEAVGWTTYSVDDGGAAAVRVRPTPSGPPVQLPRKRRQSRAAEYGQCRIATLCKKRRPSSTKIE